MQSKPRKGKLLKDAVAVTVTKGHSESAEPSVYDTPMFESLRGKECCGEPRPVLVGHDAPGLAAAPAVCQGADGEATHLTPTITAQRHQGGEILGPQ